MRFRTPSNPRARCLLLPPSSFLQSGHELLPWYHSSAHPVQATRRWQQPANSTPSGGKIFRHMVHLNVVVSALSKSWSLLQHFALRWMWSSMSSNLSKMRLVFEYSASDGAFVDLPLFPFDCLDAILALFCFMRSWSTSRQACTSSSSLFPRIRTLHRNNKYLSIVFYNLIPGLSLGMNPHSLWNCLT